MDSERLRIAIVVGTLGQAGAEKQLVYLVRSLCAQRNPPVEVRVYSLTHGEHYESALVELGCPPVWFGQLNSPVLRLVELIRLARVYRPHVIHSSHYYTNIYAGLAGTALGVLSAGSSRADPRMEVADNGRWGRWLFRVTDGMIANSHNARDVLVAMGLAPERVHVLPNVIDLAAFDRAAGPRVESPPGGLCAILVGRLIRPKRVEVFLQALAQARRVNPEIRGLIAGDGPLRGELEARAAELGLSGDGVRFLGHRSDVPALLAGSDVLVSVSELEGFPNVMLEAMAACRAVIATPAGDSARIVADGVSGYLLPIDAAPAAEALAGRLIELAAEPELRAALGAAGRRRVEADYSLHGEAPNSPADRLLAIYRCLAERAGQGRLLHLLEGPVEKA
ncbi:MAG TPA: glycosyltransferase family 4 protein [Anaerolineaceae bacterium]|nr:glycosyltransferase family 4 protein [Anaerolineaceae bacterium]